MDVVLLSRMQFAAETLFHFLFVPFTLGLSFLVAVMETQYVRTGDKTYLALTIAGATFFGVIGLFPSLFPSSIDPGYSLTAFNASSSPLTLKIMLIVVILFIPVVIGYQVWAYTLFKGKVTEAELAYEEAI